MNQQWYAQIDGVTIGPFEWRHLRQLAVEGKVTAETPVRTGDDPWHRAAQVHGLLDPSPSDPGFSLGEPGAPAAGGSRHGIAIDPSLNDTTEWRMLAATASTPVIEQVRPLPRRGAAALVGESSKAPSSRGLLIVIAGAAAILGVVAVVIAMLSR